MFKREYLLVETCVQLKIVLSSVQRLSTEIDTFLIGIGSVCATKFKTSVFVRVLCDLNMGNNEKKLRTMLKSLIAEKKSGNLDVPEKFNNQDEKWRNVLSYETLWKCIKHRCPEVWNIRISSEF